MPIKYNNFDIGNAYLGNDNLVAMYQGSNLVWTNGIKLKSLLGQRNTEQSITLSSDMNLNNAIGFGISGDGKTYPNNLWGGTYGINISIKQDHYYLYAIKVNKNILSISNTWGGFYFSTKGGYIDNQTTPYTDGEWYIGIQKSNKDFTSDNFWGIFARSLALEKGTTITCYKTIMLDLTKAKLDTLTPEQIYNLLTLNGTDFTDLELLANGYQVDLSKWKQQTTNSFKINEHNWTYDSSGKKFFTQVSDMKKISDMTISGVASANGYTTSTQNDLDSGTDMIITTNFEYIFIRDLRYTNQDDFKSAMGNTTITYELSSSNNIGGSKYGFIQIKDLTLTRADSGRFFGTLKPIKSYSTSQYANVFTEKLSVGKYGEYYSKSKDKIISSLSQDIQFYDSSCEKLDDFTEKYGSEYIVYELNNSLGDKLDNYSAEQVYYMFFSTLGNQKMYVPKGVEFESSDNVIIGTKYGIVDLGNYVWGYNGNYKFSFVSSDTLGNALKQLVKPTTADNYVGNVYLDGYTTISWNDMSADKDTDLKDKSIVVRTSGEIDIKDTRFTSYNAIQEYLKGKYLVFELRTPNGTDYNDLSAKQMYDLINDNAIDLLANGKSIGGIRSLFGKQNVESEIELLGITTINIGQKEYGSFFKAQGVNDSEKSLSITQNHKYFTYTKISGIESGYTNLRSWLWNKDTDTFDYVNLTQDNENCYGIINYDKASGNNVCNCVSMVYGDKIDLTLIIKEQILIDLTALNLSTLTAQQVYTMLKEYNLYNLTTSGEIKIGGFMKPKPSNPTFTIDSVVYEYESGMTWGAWLDSSYNTGGFTHNEEYVVDSTDTYCVVKSDYSGKAYTYDYVESIAYIVGK